MANRMTVVWLWRPTPTDPLAKLGFYQCLRSAADALVAGGYAQWPRIGAFRFNFMNRMATTIGVGISAIPASVVEGSPVTFRITLSEGVSAPVIINLARDASSTAVAGTDYVAFPASITLTDDTTTFDLVVNTIDTGVVGNRTLVIKATGNHPNVTGAPVATVTITDKLPTLASINPTSCEVAVGATVTCTGTNFKSNSVANVDNVPAPTTYVSPTSLTFTYTPATEGAKSIVVKTPSRPDTVARTLTVTPAP